MSATAPSATPQAMLSLRRLLCAVCLLAAGCDSSRDEISSYDTPKESAPPTVSGGAPAAADGRMLAAMVPAKQQMWFFKLTGPKANVDKFEATFNQLLKSLAVADDGNVTWTLPEGWSERPGDNFRRATLVGVDGDATAEVAISTLPYPGTTDDDLANYVRENVNRWRGQMQLDPATGGVDELTKPVEGTETKVLLVDLLGAAPAPMGTGGGMVTAPPLPTARPSAPAAPYTSELPAGWTEAALRPMVLAIYNTAEPVAEVAVSSFAAGGAMSDPLENINRWRRQVGMTEITATDVESSVESIKIDGQDAQLVSLIPEGDAPLAIEVAMLERDGQMWFFKLNGPSAAVNAHRDAFAKWLGTIRFANAQ